MPIKKIKKIFSLIGVFSILAVVLFSSVFYSKNQTAFASDKVTYNFNTNYHSLKSPFYNQNTDLVKGFSDYQLSYSLNTTGVGDSFNLSVNGNSNVSFLTATTDITSSTQSFNYGGDYVQYNNATPSFCDISKVNNHPHDNILVAGTYKWVNNLGSFSGVISASFNFTSNSRSFIGVFYPVHRQFLDYTEDSNSIHVYDSSSNYWYNSAYQTIILSTDQQVGSTFYDWAITQGNLVYQGGGTSVDFTPQQFYNFTYSSTDKNILNTNVMLYSTSNFKYYVPLVVTINKISNLNFIGCYFSMIHKNSYNGVSGSFDFYNVTYFTDVNFSGDLTTEDTPYINFEYYCGNLYDYNVTWFNNFGSLSNVKYYFDSSTGDNYDLGYNNGYNVGVIDGKEIGEKSGYNKGYNSGSQIGYNNGYSAGVEASNNYTFLSLISAVVTAPFNAFKSLFNFDLLGINIFNLLGALFTLAVVVTIVKKVI